MKKLKLIFTALALCISSSVTASEQITNEYVEHMNTYSTTAVIKLNGTGSNSDQCTRSNAGKYIAIVFTDGKEMFSSALSAYMANRKVGFGISGCYQWGDTTIPKAYRVDVYKN